MSLTDKVIKNTYYYVLSQVLNFVFSFILTPLLIIYIGNTEYGIYALILGVSGIFGLFDLSISSSFIKYISGYYNTKNYEELNKVINSASIFYFGFSAVCIIIALLLKDYFLRAVNIPPELQQKAFMTYIISLLAFTSVNTLGIFNSVIAAIQKMYLTSIYGIALTILNFVSVLVLLKLGFGLYGVLIPYIFFIVLSLLVSLFLSKKHIPELKFGFKYFSIPTLKKMMNFGVQMQVSKFASYAGDKYDEFLLAYFSVIGNVTFYNIGARIARVGRIIPLMLLPQVAPVAAEFKAKEEELKIETLFEDTTKYLLLISLPIFAFFILFASELISSWVGAGYETSAHILRVISVGFLINLIFSAPGNSITPNIGNPKISMYEGLIFLAINLVMSFFLVKYYGIIGAAYGYSISTSVASIYVFFVSVYFFKRKAMLILFKTYLKPIAAVLITSSVLFAANYYLAGRISLNNRVQFILFLSASGIIFAGIYILCIKMFRYLSEKDMVVLRKVVYFMKPANKNAE